MVKVAQFRLLGNKPEQLEQALRDVVRDVYSALDRDLTFKENFRGDVVTITTGVASEFRLPTTYSAKPSFVRLVDVKDEDGLALTLSTAPWPNWRYDTNGIIISSVAGLSTSVTYTLKFLIVGE